MALFAMRAHFRMTEYIGNEDDDDDEAAADIRYVGELARQHYGKRKQHQPASQTARAIHM